MTLPINAILTWCEARNACADALAWLRTQPDAATAWQTCPRADWMLWFAVRAGVERRILVRTACAIARTVLHLVPDGEERPRRAIETAEAWCDGRASRDEVRAARAAADAAARAAAAYAAYAAAAAADAADAADAAAYAAAYAAADAAAHADIVRQYITLDMLEVTS